MLLRLLQLPHAARACAAAVAPVAGALAALSPPAPPGAASVESGSTRAARGGGGGARRGLHLAPPFLVEGYTPAAVTTHRLGRMQGKVAQALAELKDCRACPRDCGVDRSAGQLGVCNVGRAAVVATAAPHYGEEACLQGWAGSGTIFFGGCSMRCCFCQNWDIAHRPKGFELTADELAGWMLKLQDEGQCHNINLVTPEHVVPQVVEALATAAARGLSLPIVYNTSGYDSLSSLRLLDGLVDIYMPDFKFWTAATAEKYARAADYPERARDAIKEMHKQVGDLVFEGDGLAKRGLLLRHLVMPGLSGEGREILAWAAAELGRDTFVNVMGQFAPGSSPLLATGEKRSRLGFVSYEELRRRPPTSEVEELIAFARSKGLWRFEEAPRWEQRAAELEQEGELAA
ncbi:MAG: radical SAM superfamily protein [Monoraphidium minutum]|nr:MAG: radical SAM superfamily protein [Monoraphidium minutum]